MRNRTSKKIIFYENKHGLTPGEGRLLREENGRKILSK